MSLSEGQARDTLRSWLNPGQQGINGQTQLIGVMGWPVAHSFSPVMHNVVLRELGLNWCYVPLPVHPRRVREAVYGMAALGFRGVNVTVPHKRAVMALMDTLSPEAEAVGAVNTLVVSRDAEGGTILEGHNTDVSGFVEALRASGFDPAHCRHAVVVGAGGAARAVVYGLMMAGTEAITVLNRTPARAEALVSDMQRASTVKTEIHAYALNRETLVTNVYDAELLVNATTVGMWPKTNGSIWLDTRPLPRDLTVCDLVYNPLETRLLHQARLSGAKVVDGLSMLARQGALALAKWLAHPIDVNAVATRMQEVCARMLGNGESS